MTNASPIGLSKHVRTWRIFSSASLVLAIAAFIDFDFIADMLRFHVWLTGMLWYFLVCVGMPSDCVLIFRDKKKRWIWGTVLILRACMAFPIVLYDIYRVIVPVK